MTRLVSIPLLAGFLLLSVLPVGVLVFLWGAPSAARIGYGDAFLLFLTVILVGLPVLGVVLALTGRSPAVILWCLSLVWLVVGTMHVLGLATTENLSFGEFLVQLAFPLYPMVVIVLLWRGRGPDVRASAG